MYMNASDTEIFARCQASVLSGGGANSCWRSQTIRDSDCDVVKPEMQLDSLSNTDSNAFD